MLPTSSFFALCRRLIGPFGLGILVACAAPAAEETAQDEGAFSESRGDRIEMAARARQVAERIAAHDPSVLRVPLGETPADDLASRSFERWQLALVSAEDHGAAVRGFYFLPQGGSGAPPGSFAVAIADASSGIVASAAYVPDTEKEASAIARRMLDALAEDAASLGAGRATVKPQRFGVGAAVEAVLKLFARSAEKGAIAPENARIPAMARSAIETKQLVWDDFARLFANPETIKVYAVKLMTIRASVAKRSVVLLQSSPACVGGKLVATCAERLAKVGPALDAELGHRTSDVALALADDPNYAAEIRWALAHDVPIVVTSMTDDTGKSVLENIALSIEPIDAALAAELRAAAGNPAKAGLLHVLDVAGQEIEAAYVGALRTGEIRELAPLWTIADEAIALDAAGMNARVQGWLRAFDRLVNL